MQLGAGGRSPTLGGRIGVAVPRTAGSIQACGVEHRRAGGHHIGEQVAAGVGCPAHRLLGGAGAGQLDRIVEVDAHLKHLWFGVEHRAQAGDVVLGGEKPPARAQVQPEPSVDLRAQLRELGGGLVAGSAAGELEETVAFPQLCAVGGGQAGIEHQEAPDP